MKNLFRPSQPVYGDDRSQRTRNKPDNDTRPPWGIHILVNKDAEATGVVDIVAIHGLNGHYRKTWTFHNDQHTRVESRKSADSLDDEVNWLRDLLPLTIPNARVMSYAYNSAVQFSKSTSDVFIFADQLLEHIMAVRLSKEEQIRPLLFVCHSLGGIVFKQAVNRASQNKERYQQAFLERLIGVLFFGTPHRGSGLANWANILGRVLKVGSFGTSTNSQLAGDLRRDSKVLENISKSFVHSSHDFKIFSFFETDKMNLLNCKVVDEESATLGWKNEVCVALEGNHRSICKFSKRDNSGFQIVLRSLLSCIENTETRDPDQMRKEMEVRRDLYSSDYESHMERNTDPVQGTCVWILEHAKFQAWLDEPGASLIWISADPGCGKSVLTKFLVHKYRQAFLQQANICYFFFKADNEEQCGGTKAMSALLHQLYTLQPSLTQIAMQQLLRPGQSVKSLSALWRIFIHSTEEPQARPTICFLDGLDECEEGSRRQLVSFISKYFGPSDEPESFKRDSRKKLKVLVTSRPENSIKIAFDRPQSMPQRGTADSNSDDEFPDHPRIQRFEMMRLRGEDETDAISRDITLVVKDAMRDLVNRQMPLGLLKNIEMELITRADRTFLWITLIIQLLKDRAEDGASRRELEAVLNSRSLYAVYSELLNSKPNYMKARKMLSIVLAAVRPLTVEELSIALAVQPDHQTFKQSTVPRRPSSTTFDNLECDLVYPFENHIKALCGHFVRVIHTKVYLVHQTAREFLLDQASIREFYDDTLTVPMDEEETLWSFEDDQPVEKGSSMQPYDDLAPASPTTGRNPSLPIWQHSVSLVDSNALLLEICVSYLYLLGKKSHCARLGLPSRESSPFLAYAASSWVDHFRKVRQKIPQADLPYYQSLCHPRFPGFQRWIEISRNQLLLGASDDEQQDYLVKSFGLERGDLGLDEEIGEATNAMNLGVGPDDMMSKFSSNPDAQMNRHFPVKAGETGFVSLDLEEAQKMFASKNTT